MSKKLPWPKQALSLALLGRHVTKMTDESVFSHSFSLPPLPRVISDRRFASLIVSGHTYRFLHKDLGYDKSKIPPNLNKNVANRGKNDILWRRFCASLHKIMYGVKTFALPTRLEAVRGHSPWGPQCTLMKASKSVLGGTFYLLSCGRPQISMKELLTRSLGQDKRQLNRGGSILLHKFAFPQVVTRHE